MITCMAEGKTYEEDEDSYKRNTMLRNELTEESIQQIRAVQQQAEKKETAQANLSKKGDNVASMHSECIPN